MEGHIPLVQQANVVSRLMSPPDSLPCRSGLLKGSIGVCLVSFMFSPLVGGAETRAEKQARQLQALGHDVIVVTLRHDKQWKRREILDGLPVIRVGGIYKRGGRLRIGRLGHLP